MIVKVLLESISSNVNIKSTSNAKLLVKNQHSCKTCIRIQHTNTTKATINTITNRTPN